MTENELKSQPALLHMTVTVTRAQTGKTETYELTGTSMPAEPEPQAQPPGEQDVSHP